jgi:hypothetical protein
VNVKKDPAALKAMLAANGGLREVPTLVEPGGAVTIGFDGGT